MLLIILNKMIFIFDADAIYLKIILSINENMQSKFIYNLFLFNKLNWANLSLSALKVLHYVFEWIEIL